MCKLEEEYGPKPKEVCGMTCKNTTLLILWLVGFCLPSALYVVGFMLDHLGTRYVLPWWSLYVEIPAAILLCGIAIGRSGQRAGIRALLMLGTMLGLFVEYVVIWWVIVCRTGFLTGTQ